MKGSNFKPTPRSMSEAFGPNARLDIEPRRLPGTGLVPWIVTGVFVAVLCYRVFS